MTELKDRRIALLLLFVGILMGSCQAAPTILEVPPEEDLASVPADLSAAEIVTLTSLEQVDQYPLYTMVYQADYAPAGDPINFESEVSVQADWACSLFATFGDPHQALLGRNFDWDFSPGLLLFTDPDQGYASVSMVDLYYLGYGNERAFGLTELPLEELERLLDAPYLPFDGMNETGLAVGMAAVPDGGVPPNPQKETIDSLLVMRKILDEAATIDQAVAIIRTYNIDWGSGPALHYLIADESGRSALIEFSKGELVIQENQEPWQVATNFLVSETLGDPEEQCWRYGLLRDQLESSGGMIRAQEGIALLEDVAQQNTQWSVVYQISAGEVWIAMGRDYSSVHQFPFPPGK